MTIRTGTYRFAVVAILMVALPRSAMGQECLSGADLGIERLLCRAGWCFVNRGVGSEVLHDFAVEPSIAALRTGGPADGRLQVGDVLTSVDGILVTTPEGGRRLARLEPGRPTRLGLRRQGVPMEVVITPRAGCAPGLIVYGGDLEPPMSSRPPGGLAIPRVSFGLWLQCDQCGWELAPDGGRYFRSIGPVRVERVDPNGPGARAGLLVGDSILAVDGNAIESPSASHRLGTLQPGEEVVFRVQRGSRQVEVPIRPDRLGFPPF